MGIRPQMFTVFGIDDYDGPANREILECQVFLSTEDLENNSSLHYIKDYTYDYPNHRWRWYRDLVYIGCEEFDRSERIIGWIKSGWEYDSDTFRALAMLYPEFMKSSHKDIPYITDEDKKQWRWRHRKATPCGGIEFQPHWFYEQGMYWLTPVWAYITKWLLDSLGIETDPTQYKWMLVWTWS